MQQNSPEDFYEIAGHQQDKKERERASKLLIKSGAAILGPIFLIIILVNIPSAIVNKKENFARFDSSADRRSDLQPVSIRVLSSKRTEEVDSRFFMTAKARENFIFQVIDIEIHNNTKDDQQLSPFMFGLYGHDGSLTRPHIATHNHPERLKATTLKPDEKIQGYIIFQVPLKSRSSRVELMAAGGSRGSSRL